MQSRYTHPENALNLYEILRLPQPLGPSSRPPSKDEVKTAYHRALLLNHPDKIVKERENAGLTERFELSDQQYSIDEIMRAYQVLVDDKLRATYNQQLLNGKAGLAVEADEAWQKGTHLGVDVFDLEDLDYDDTTGQWRKVCRCGDEAGYTVTEAELEQESKEGEIYVGCCGCSLFIKVLFSLAEDGNTT